MKKLQKLEALRGLAAIYVAANHLYPGFLFGLRLGQEAVILFFLLSGFVIEYSNSTRPISSFRTYLTRRTVRIYVVLIPMFALVAALTQQELSRDFALQLAGNIFMLQDIGFLKPNTLVEPLYANALWSLHYEWWFYMLFFPCSKTIPKPHQKHVVGAIAVVSATIYHFTLDPITRLLSYFSIWWLGAEMGRSFAANGRVVLADIKASCAWLMGVVAAFAFGVATSTNSDFGLSLGRHPVLEFRHAVSAIGIVTIALAWQRSRWLGFGILRPGALFAPISYSIYICHQPLLVNATFLDGALSQPVRFIAYLAILFSFCALSELWLFPVIQRRVRHA